MSDLGSHLWDMACAITKAHADELRCPQAIATKADTLQGSSTAQSAIPLFSQERRDEDISAHVAKIPLREELRALEQAVQIYAERAAQLAGESARCQMLSDQARAIADNLRKMGDL